MAIRLSAMGGAQRFMNDYEQQDQLNAARNAAALAAASQAQAQLNQRQAMADQDMAWRDQSAAAERAWRSAENAMDPARRQFEEDRDLRAMRRELALQTLPDVADFEQMSRDAARGELTEAAALRGARMGELATAMGDPDSPTDWRRSIGLATRPEEPVPVAGTVAGAQRLPENIRVVAETMQKKTLQLLRASTDSRLSPEQRQAMADEAKRTEMAMAALLQLGGEAPPEPEFTPAEAELRRRAIPEVLATVQPDDIAGFDELATLYRESSGELKDSAVQTLAQRISQYTGGEVTPEEAQARAVGMLMQREEKPSTLAGVKNLMGVSPAPFNVGAIALDALGL